MEVIAYFRSEWAVIVQAPVTFVIALVLLAALIWAVIDRLYKQELSTKNATIELLRERLDHRSGPADSTLRQGPVSPKTPAPSPAAQVDPDGVYQLGRMVGKVIAPRVHRSASRVTFEAITDTANLDQSKPFQYRDMNLVLKSFETAIGMKVVAGPHGSETLTNVIEGVTCQIS